MRATTHHLHLDADIYQLVASGSKTVESRLNDEKRQLIRTGDTIIFKDRGSNHTLKASVTALEHYDTFEELFATRPAQDFGGPGTEWLLGQVHGFYSQEDITRYGVLGIVIRLQD